MYETKDDKWDNTLFRKIQFKESAPKLSTTGTKITKKGQATAEICDGISRGMKRQFDELTDFSDGDLTAFLFAPPKRRALEGIKKPDEEADEKADEGKADEGKAVGERKEREKGKATVMMARAKNLLCCRCFNSR